MRTVQFAFSTIVLLCSLLFFNSYAQAQGRTDVRGVVRSEAGTILSGASVIVKNGANNFSAGTTTDSAGVFVFKGLASGTGYSFTVTHVGYEPQTLDGNTFQPGTAFSIVIKLREDKKTLDDVVVVGYGTQRRKDLTSAVASVKSTDFVKGAVTDAAQLIRGKVAGLTVITPDGNPTATAQVLLRGTGSISYGANPLVIIDGVPGTLNTVAPEDIEQVDVLKDGSAAAIYGTRGTNGVILITTRKVNVETPATIDVNSYVTVQSISKKLSFFNAQQYRQLVAEGKPGAQDYGASTNWLDEISRTPISQVHTVNFRGGNRTTNYVANFQYRSMQGLIDKSNNQVFFPRLEINHSMFGGKLKFNGNINGYQQVFNAGTDGGAYRGDVYRNALTYNPTDPVKTANDTWTEHTDKTDYANPAALLQETHGSNKNSDFRAFGTLTAQPIQGLQLKMLGSHEIFNSVRGYYETKQHISTVRDGKNGFASRGTTRTTDDLIELTAQYSRNFKGHNITALGGYSWRSYFSENYWMQNWDFPTDFFTYNNIGTGKALTRGQAPEYSYAEKTVLLSYFGRVNYSFRDKYLLMASIRREGSSTFGADHKWGNFPAVSAGWNIQKESFMNNVQWLSTLKIRGGYGITGTLPGSPYLSLNTLTFSSFAYINGQWIQVISPASNPNPDLRWEKKKELNVGLDFGFFKDRLSGTLDIYQRRISDLIIPGYPVSTPPYLYTSIPANAGTMENKGVELQINFIPVSTKRFQWSGSVNWSTNTNKVISFSNDKFQGGVAQLDFGSTGEPIQTFTHRLQLGGAVGNFWGYKSVGVDDDGRWIIEGKDGKPKPIAQQQADDKQVIGNGLPKHYVNFNNSFTYGNLDLSITMRGAFGFDILNMAQMFYGVPVMLTRGNLLTTAYNPVYGKRPLADNQELQYVSYFIQKGDYWKIDNVTLGYNFNVSKVAFLKRARLYASVSNLLTFTGYKGIDPEVSLAGLAPGVDDRNRYPATRTFTVGTFLTF